MDIFGPQEMTPPMSPNDLISSNQYIYPTVPLRNNRDGGGRNKDTFIDRYLPATEGFEPTLIQGLCKENPLRPGWSSGIPPAHPSSRDLVFRQKKEARTRRLSSVGPYSNYHHHPPSDGLPPHDSPYLRHILLRNQVKYSICCKQLFPSNSHFEGHRLRVHQYGYYSCSLHPCDRVFHRKFQLFKHENDMHSLDHKGPINCSICFTILPHPEENENYVKDHAVLHLYS